MGSKELSGEPCKERKEGMRRRAAAAAAAGAMITGHFIPHWKTEGGEGERERERECVGSAAAAAPVGSAAMPVAGRPPLCRPTDRPHILKHVDRRKMKNGMHCTNLTLARS